jgi:hypothetical protein
VQYGKVAQSYFEHGVLPLPVSGTSKRPAVRGWNRAKPDAARRWMTRFADAPAIGLVLGARAGVRTPLTVLDIDTTDEREVSRAMDRHGRTPLVARTRSGGFQAWYRHGGEGRRIRPWGKTLPIDLLGGGFAIVPPSLDEAYRFVAGDLDDLEDLPPLRGLEGLLPSPAPEAATDTSDTDEALIRRGRRATEVWRYCMEVAPDCATEAELIALALRYRREAIAVHDHHPFTENDAMREARRAWKQTQAGRNYIAGRGYFDPLDVQDCPDAVVLWLVVQREHAGLRDEFVLANGLARRLGWWVERFRKARDRLAEAGAIECIHRGGSGKNDPPRYRWGAKTIQARSRR